MPYIVKSSAANMPNSCWGKYKRVAVIEMEAGASFPKMISIRARGVKRIVARWERLNVGITNKCAYQRALAEATSMADKLNTQCG